MSNIFKTIYNNFVKNNFISYDKKQEQILEIVASEQNRPESQSIRL